MEPTMIAVSGEESRIVSIEDQYYVITDYKTAADMEEENWHAFKVVRFNNSWWQPQLNERYLINRETLEITDDPREYYEEPVIPDEPVEEEETNE